MCEDAKANHLSCLVSVACQLNKQTRHTCMLMKLKSDSQWRQFFPEESTRFRIWIIVCCHDKPLANVGQHSNGSSASVTVTSSLVGVLLFGLRLSSCCSLPTRQMQYIATLRWTPASRIGSRKQERRRQRLLCHVCGRCVREPQTILVGDAHPRDDHLSPQTNSFFFLDFTYPHQTYQFWPVFPRVPPC